MRCSPAPHPFLRAMKIGSKKKKISVFLVAALAFAAVFTFSAVMLGLELIQAKGEADAFSELASLRGPLENENPRQESKLVSPTELKMDQNEAHTEKSTDISASVTDSPASQADAILSAEEQKEPTPLQKYVALYELNTDFFGWITIPDTNIDYPVMYSPTRKDFYLSHDYYGKSAATGVPYLDEDCDPNGSLYLIYGHHPDLGTMFSHIIDYQKESFWETHKEIHFDTRYEERTYIVVAAMKARALTRGDRNGFHYYNYTSLETEEVFEEYMQQVKELALYDTGIEVSFGDELLVLSTCFHYVSNGRFVVIAKRIDNNGQ